MGVYIKGMEMPKNCFECPWRCKVDPDNLLCRISGEYFEETFSGTIQSRHKSCPLIEIPPYADRRLIPEIREKQQDATEDDFRVGMIQDYLTGRSETCVLELWQRALGMSEFFKPTKKESNEISIIMQSLDGWQKQPKVKRFQPYGIQRWWSKTGTEWVSEIEELDDELPL